jgi:hypothetical protein
MNLLRRTWQLLEAKIVTGSRRKKATQWRCPKLNCASGP